MHSRLIDIARYGACAAAQEDDARSPRRVSALWWVVPLVAFWVIVAMAVM